MTGGGSGAIERGTLWRSRWARIAAFMSSFCDCSLILRNLRHAAPVSSRPMCFDADSAPPIPVISGAAVSHDDLTLTAADGNEFAAFRAMPEGPATTGVIVLPDVRGLYHFYEELALRFAERGYAALAMDYFGRTAGAERRDDEFEYMPHVGQTTDDGVQADTRAAAAHLRGLGVEQLFTVGFCFGGRASWVAAASGHGLAGAIGFYGSPTRERGGPSVVARANDITAPILALQAGGGPHNTAAGKR